MGVSQKIRIQTVSNKVFGLTCSISKRINIIVKWDGKSIFQPISLENYVMKMWLKLIALGIPDTEC
jgi:hypothetical protein